MHISEFMSEDQHHFTWNYRKVSSVIQYGVSSLLAYENESKLFNTCTWWNLSHTRTAYPNVRVKKRTQLTREPWIFCTTLARAVVCEHTIKWRILWKATLGFIFFWKTIIFLWNNMHWWIEHIKSRKVQSMNCICDMLFITRGNNCSRSFWSFIKLFVKTTWK